MTQQGLPILQRCNKITIVKLFIELGPVCYYKSLTNKMRGEMTLSTTQGAEHFKTFYCGNLFREPVLLNFLEP